MSTIIFQPLENVKTILSSQAVQKQARLGSVRLQCADRSLDQISVPQRDFL